VVPSWRDPDVLSVTSLLIRSGESRSLDELHQRRTLLLATLCLAPSVGLFDKTPLFRVGRSVRRLAFSTVSVSFSQISPYPFHARSKTLHRRVVVRVHRSAPPFLLI